MECWRQAAQAANEKPVLTLKEQKEVQRNERAMAEMVALQVLREKWDAFY